MISQSDTIIVATDFSAPADRAVERAALLARSHGARLRLVHAVGEGDWLARMSLGMQGYFNAELLRKSAGSRLARERDRLVEAGHGDVGYEVVEGSLSAALPHLMHEGEHGILVMGARGETGFRDGLLGSTADRVIRAGVLPVLLARADPGRDYARVVLATDFSTASAQAARLGIHWAPGASFYLLHALELPLDRSLAFANATDATKDAFHHEAALQAGRSIEQFADGLGIDAAAITRAPREGPPAAVLDAFVAEVAADLVVLGSRPRARWEANLLGSTSLFATNRLPCDVLLVPEKLAG